MFAYTFENFLRAALFVIASLLTAPVIADSGQTKVVRGMQVVFGIVPAEMIRSHPKEHAEGSMHGGPPYFTSGQYHVMIAVFDSKTGDRITDAAVKAKVTEPGLSSEEKKLEPMKIADAMSFGNYFKMPGKGPFEITVQIRTRAVAAPIEVKFHHKH